MIRPLRRGHRRTVVLLAVVLPALYLIALAARQDTVLMTSLPTPITALRPQMSTMEDGVTISATAQIYARLASGADGRWIIALRVDRPLRHPDVLVYWTAAAGGQPQRLPVDARLLGVLSDTQQRMFSLPGRGPGEIVLYSPAHDTIVARAAIPATTTVASEGGG